MKIVPTRSFRSTDEPSHSKSGGTKSLEIDANVQLRYGL
jgi:hypothetical protein